MYENEGVNNKDSNNYLKLTFKLLIIAIFIYGGYTLLQYLQLEPALNDIQPPTQTRISGIYVKNINGVNVLLNYVATYSITGRVVYVEKYEKHSNEISDVETMLDALSQRDVGISWGFLANYKNHIKVKWTSRGDRHLEFRTTDLNWLNDLGGLAYVNQYWSNNHLIPSDDTTNKKINEIKAGDYITIEGYLVNLLCEITPVKHARYATSTTRDDTGSGACEVIYVTNVTWHKKSLF